MVFEHDFIRCVDVTSTAASNTQLNSTQLKFNTMLAERSKHKL